jgi:hypothetical protein
MSEIVTLSLNLDLSIWYNRVHSVARLWRIPMLMSNILWRFAVHLPSVELIRMWFYANREVVSTWEKCSNAFLAKFFLLGKTNVLQNKILIFQ